MKVLKYSLVALLLTAFGLGTSVGCTAPPEEKKEPPPFTEITFSPASGALDVKDSCITVKFSTAPERTGWTAEFKAGDQTVNGTFAFEDDQTAKFCPFAMLKPETKHSLKVSVESIVESADEKPKVAAKSVDYTTGTKYQDKEAPAAGLTVNLQLKDILAPRGLTEIVSSLSSDNIPPILVTIHKRDTGKKGNLLLVGGLGMSPEKKPHNGKDIVDTKTPVSLLLEGTFNGRQFTVGPTTFVLSIAGFSLELQDFSLTGVFTEDGKNIEEARLIGVIDPKLVKERFNLDICKLLRGECYKDKSGMERIRLAGRLDGITNPLPFSVFITDPLYLQSGVEATKLTFYTNKELDEKSVVTKLFTCKGSTDPEKPCDPKKEAKVEAVKEAGKIEYDSAERKGSYTPAAAFQKGVWYRAEMEAKDKEGKETFKTFVIFKK